MEIHFYEFRSGKFPWDKEPDRARQDQGEELTAMFQFVFFLLCLLNDAEPLFIPAQREQAFLSGIETPQLKSLSGASMPVLFPVLLIENPQSVGAALVFQTDSQQTLFILPPYGTAFLFTIDGSLN